jgi:hypothetical protein
LGARSCHAVCLADIIVSRVGISEEFTDLSDIGTAPPV